MTIAMCAIVPERIVLGADSTSSLFFDDNGFHYFNHNQKIFEVGEGSTFGVVTWGLGALGEVSYRTLLAEMDDGFVAKPPKSVEDVAKRWSDHLWITYQQKLVVELARINLLDAKQPFDPNANPPGTNSRTSDEEDELQGLISKTYVGFCIAGNCPPDRSPKAFQIHFHAPLSAAPKPVAVTQHTFWGAPNFILRLINGWDQALKANLLSSANWTGTEADLDAVLQTASLPLAPMPLRDAIDFVYSSIHSTIKALKFSNLSQICGGPIELAVISTDRRFRWVRHKKWDVAVTEGDIA